MAPARGVSLSCSQRASVHTLTRGLASVLPSAWPIVTADGASSGWAALKARNCAQALRRCLGRSFE